jgi:hypothetical protein
MSESAIRYVDGAGAVVYRASRGELDCPSGEARVECALPLHRWALLALNVAERVQRDRIHMQVYAHHFISHALFKYNFTA